MNTKTSQWIPNLNIHKYGKYLLAQLGTRDVLRTNYLRNRVFIFFLLSLLQTHSEIPHTDGYFLFWIHTLPLFSIWSFTKNYHRYF